MSSAGRRGSHPPGLYVLFFTELWERYSFYALMALMTLYMDEVLRFPERVSAQVYGGFIAAVYLLPLAGGALADRWLGFARTVILGAVLMGIGQLVLAGGGTTAFFVALGLVATGTGLLKPNVSTIVGSLYRDRRELSDSAFNIFYMGINIGAFIAPVMVAWLRAHYGWSAAFGSAALAMVAALIVFVGFGRYLPREGGAAGAAPADAAELRVSDRARVVALLAVFAIVVAFWLAFYQNGFTLTLWARDNTATSIPPEEFQAVEPLGIIAFTPLLVAAWGALRRHGREPSTLSKMVLGMLLTAAAFVLMATAGCLGGNAGRVSPAWLVVAYLVIAVAEISLSPMGLSLVTKVAPARLRATMMGGWFVATAAGGYFAGFVGTYWRAMPHSRFFLMVVGISLVAAAVMMVARRRLALVFTAAGA